MRKAIVFVGVVSVLAVFGASPALAMPPVHERWSFEATEVLPEEVCGFPVSLEISGRQTVIVFFDADGTPRRALSTGPISLTVNGERRVSISGPGFYSADGSMAAGTGPWLMGTEDGLAVTRGRWRLVDGQVEASGSLIDVCDLARDASSGS